MIVKIKKTSDSHQFTKKFGFFSRLLKQTRNSWFFIKQIDQDPLLTKIVLSRWLDTSFVLFLRVFMDIDFVLVHKNAKIELGQCPTILTFCLVNNAYASEIVISKSTDCEYKRVCELHIK